MYTPASVLPTISEMAWFQWSRPDAENPRLAAPVSDSATTLKFNYPPLDKDGNVITRAFLIGIRNEASYVESVLVPAGALSVDGKTATGVIRGVRLEGLDWTTGDSSLAVQHKSGDSVFCQISGVTQMLNNAAINGEIATGGTEIKIGDGTDSDVTIIAALSSDTGFIKKNATSGKAQYSNDGAIWNDIDDVAAGSLVVISGADTTPGNLDSKVAAGDGVVKTTLNPGANEELEIATDGTATVTAADTTHGYLADKITAGTGVAITTLNPGANEELEITATGSTSTDVEYTAAEDIAAGELVSVDENGEVVRTILYAGDATGATITGDPDTLPWKRTVLLEKHKIALCFVDNAWDVKLIIGTMNDDRSMTWGVETNVATGTYTDVNICKIDDDKVAIVVSDGTGSDAYVATISGTTPTVGTVAAIATNADYNDCCKLDTDKFLVVYDDDADGSKGKCVVCTVSGTTVTVGTPVEFDTDAVTWVRCARLNTDKACISYNDSGASDIKFSVVSVSGTTPSPTSPTQLDNLDARVYGIGELDDDHVVVFYQKIASGYEGWVTAVTVSGLIATIGTPVEFENIGSFNYVYGSISDGWGGQYFGGSSGFSSNNITHIFSYSGTTITETEHDIFNGYSIQYTSSVCPLTDDGVSNAYLHIFNNNGISDDLWEYVHYDKNNTDSFVGISQTTDVAGNTIEVRSKGVDSNQAGLTAGEQYSIASNDIGLDSPGVGAIVGIAKSATEIDVGITQKASSYIIGRTSLASNTGEYFYPNGSDHPGSLITADEDWAWSPIEGTQLVSFTTAATTHTINSTASVSVYVNGAIVTASKIVYQQGDSGTVTSYFSKAVTAGDYVHIYVSTQGSSGTFATNWSLGYI